jgi:serralysin
MIVSLYARILAIKNSIFKQLDRLTRKKSVKKEPKYLVNALLILFSIVLTSPFQLLFTNGPQSFAYQVKGMGMAQIQSVKNSAGVSLFQSAAPVKVFYGTGKVETLLGTDGADAFRGNGGGDTLKGGAGDDSYYIYDVRDVAVESAGQGVDTVNATVNYTLGANIENLILAGVATSQTYGGGNALDNVMTGGLGEQTFEGKGGNDVLSGGAGADTFVLGKGDGRDVITDFETGVDHVRLKGFSLNSFDQVKTLMHQDGADVRLELQSGEAVIFKNHNVSDFSAKDFQLGLDTSKLKMTFDDEFNSLNLWNGTSGTWRTVYQGGGLDGRTLKTNGEQQIYMDPSYTGTGKAALGVNPFAINDGVLSITAAKASADVSAAIGGYQFTSGLLTTKFSYAQLYGYFEIKAKLPDEAGMWPAFWLLPADGTWPPELDVFEQLGKDPNTVYVTAHSQASGSHTGDQDAVHLNATADGFHTYGVSWQKDYLVYYVDGVEVSRQATPADMNKPMYMLVNMAVGGGWAGNTDADFTSAQMQIDYIRAYSQDGSVTNSSGNGGSATIPEQALIAPSITNSTLTAGVDNVAYTKSITAVEVHGGAGDDYIVGSNFDDTLYGDTGNDTLSGGAGVDKLVGGLGDDVYVVDNAQDSIVENAGEGYDTVQSSVSWTLGANLETLVLTGTAAINGTGNALDNRMIGNSAANTLTGGAGADYLDGGAGADRLVGGLGDDVYVVDNALDSIVENAGEGYDTVQSSVSWTLGGNLEALVLTGTAAINGTGNALDNRIIGNSAANILSGGDGNDSLDGAGGIDTLIGGRGDDVYVVDNAQETLVEKAGEGRDTVQSSVTWKLGDNFEALVLTGKAAIDGTGNALDNSLIGNVGSNHLYGGAGNDTIDGGAGDDFLSGGLGADTFIFRAGFGHDVITDFSATQQDMLNLSGLRALGAPTISQIGHDTMIAFADGETISLIGVTATDPNFLSHINW